MKRIIISLAFIAIILIIVIGGTVAYFSDVEISKGNAFSAGALDLKIRDQDERYGNGVTATWQAKDAKPGDEWNFDIPFIGLFNEGTLKANHLEITCDFSVIEEKPCIESDTDCQTDKHPEKMAKEMIITKAIYRGTENGKSFCLNVLNGKKYTSFHPTGRYCFGKILATSTDWKIEDKDNDGKITFYDLKTDYLDNLPPPDEETFYIMDVKFDETAGNDFQKDTFDLTMIFTLNQDASQ